MLGICKSADLNQSNLWQISVPEDYLNKTFGELFHYLAIKRNLIALGLYRLPGVNDNNHPYVFTNPPDDIKLTIYDKVFLQGYHQPDDLKDVGEKNNSNMAQNIMDKGYIGHDANQNQSKKDMTPQMNTDNMKNNFIDKKQNEDETNNQERNESNSGVYSVLADVNALINDLDVEVKTLHDTLNTQDSMIIEKIKDSQDVELNIANKIK